MTRPTMTYDDPEIRRAYLAGVRDAVEGVIPFCPADRARELEEWISADLAAWSGGGPPPAPWLWPED